MPTRRIEHVALPYAGQRYTPDTSRLAAIYSRGGEQLANLSMQRGQNTAGLFERLGAIFSGYQGLEREKKAAIAALALRATEKADERTFEATQKKLERDERAAERKADKELRKEEQDRSAARYLVDNTQPGVVPTALAELALRFPETAARFTKQTTLPATVTPGAMGEVSQEPTPTGQVLLHPNTDDARAAEQLAAARESAAAAGARAGVDDRRQALALAEAMRHNRVMENKPTQPPMPVVVQTPSGPAVLDRNSRTAQPITMGGQTVGVTPTAAERMDSRKFSKAAPVLDGIGELSERINTLQGVIASASGVAEKAKAKVNLNDDVAEYEALVSGFTPMIARALGHTGVLTQQDVDSVKALFPRPEDSKTLRDRKINRMKTIIGQLEGIEGVEPAAPAGAVERWERGPDGKPRKVGG